jgi:uncharacterized protein (DUF1015 family)
MAEIRPFQGVRYDPAIVGELSAVVCPPYDVISPSAQAELYGRSPYNVVRLELGRESAADTTAESRYTRAAADYRSWRVSGALAPDAAPGFYVYDETFSHDGSSITRRSLVAPVRLANWDEGVVLPHEHTLPKAKADRLELLTATHTQFSPLLAIYDDPGDIRETLADAAARAPDVEVEVARGAALAAAAATHRLWQVAAPSVLSKLVDAWAPMRLYIADGHHRYETALAYRDAQRQAGVAPGGAADYVLMAMVEANDPGLVLLPTHRVVRGIGAINPRDILDRLGDTFVVERFASDDPRALGPAADNRPSIAVLGLAPGAIHRLTVRLDVDLAQRLPDAPPVLRELDTLILQRLILEPILGFSRAEAEAGERIQYTRDPDEALHAYASGDASLVFFLAATPLELLRDAMRAGTRMPQKTTYFYPKPVTGLVFFDHDVAWNQPGG